jgi:hypothetical protein
MAKVTYKPIAYKALDPADNIWKWAWSVLVLEDHLSHVDETKVGPDNDILCDTEEEALQCAAAFAARLKAAE